MVKWYMVPWAVFVWLFGFVYRWTLQVLWNVIGNAVWYARMLFDKKRPWREVTAKKEEFLTGSSKNWASFVKAMSGFKYAYDGISSKLPRGLKVFTMWTTWTATVRVSVYRGMKGNCQDAVQLARAILRCLQKNNQGLIEEYRVQVYVPLDPSRLEYTHYIVSGYVTEKEQTVPFIVSNSHVVKNLRRDECARNLLDYKGVKQFVWVTGKPWTVKV